MFSWRRDDRFSPGRFLWIAAAALLAGVWFIATHNPARLAAVEAAGPQPTPVPAANAFLEPSTFVQIPGPNPILTRGGAGSWDEDVIEASDAFKDFGTYHFYYHGVSKDKNRWRGGYRIGVATSQSPLGPFTKFEKNPIVDLGPSGSWDSQGVACAMILKVNLDKYYMWYCGVGDSEPHKKWTIGLATASSPLGPWTKYEKNPVMDYFGYPGGVVQVDNKFYLYSAHPIDSTGNDYSPMSMAVAEHPEGPWTEYVGNPVLKQGSWGAWDDGGFSEAEVVYWEGVFHMFYGGAKLYKPRMLTRESIGYAYSFDGFHFQKYGRNPVATREAIPNAAALSEVHSLFEPPFIYLYHTLRYKEPAPTDKQVFPRVEDLGVNVLAMQTPFRLSMPAVTKASLGAKASTSLEETFPIALSTINRVSITAECRYDAAARAGIRIRVRSSYDGFSYDTADLSAFENDLKAGQFGRKTIDLNASAKFIKILVENPDERPVSDLKVVVTLGG